jgi:hypothetical protein
MNKMDSWTDDVGNTVVYSEDFPRNIYWKPEGSDRFLTLRVEGFGGNNTHHRLNYHNPHDPVVLKDKVYYTDGNVYRDRNSLCFAPNSGDPIIFHEMKRIELDPASIVPLPTIRVKEYLLGNSSGAFIYTSYDKFHTDPRKFFIGEFDNMKSIEILSYERYRDGGTTYIKTTQGTLFVPTPFDKSGIIKFEDERFFEFDWPVEEGEDTASLKLDSFTQRKLVGFKELFANGKLPWE